MKPIRCAIYTRKSSEEGLEQDFNSLDAQHEACAAYVLSQASEGWKLLPERYDDGGLSGGTLARPALQRLLADVAAGRIDIIVVYKVDRLTRSLLDFSKLVEAFDAGGTSFVSVTQSFNTTTSMGRLTLNMLLSFAQFEREVTAERIRDKIAASKAKGMWMGGTPPLGYRPDGRSLVIIEEHAELVRDIFARYRRLGNVRLVAEDLAADGITTPHRVTSKGNVFGGRVFTRGQLYAILRNPIYAGDIAHKGKVYPGNHPAIIERDEWEAVQFRLNDNINGQRTTRRQSASLLAGLLYDPEGQPLVAVHTSKGAQRYRYYVSKAAHHRSAPASTPALRLPASEIEQVIRKELDVLLADPLRVAELWKVDLVPGMLDELIRLCSAKRTQLEGTPAAVIKDFLVRVVVHPTKLECELAGTWLATLAGGTDDGPRTAIAHEIAVRLTRSGHVMRLVDDTGAAPVGQPPDERLLRLIITARRWWVELAKGIDDISTLARREGVNASYMSRAVRLAFLAPDVVEAVLTANLRVGFDRAMLLSKGGIAPRWEEQAKTMLPGA